MKARDIQSLTPKIFIKDDGTDYDSGEEFNGLWPGFANIGHWRLNERKGVIGFNNKDRRTRNLYLSNTRWLVDSQGSYIRYKLPGDLPLENPGVNQYIMVGSGGNFNEQRSFSRFLKSHGMGPHTFNYQFDAWVGIERLPDIGKEEVLLYIHDTKAETGFDRVLKFTIENVGGDIRLAMSMVNQNRTNWTKLYSEKAADPIKDNLPGFHHIGFVYRAGLPSYHQFITTDQQLYLSKDSPYPSEFMTPNPQLAELISSADREFYFYIDGQFQEADNSNNLSDWYVGTIAIDVNPFIGCQISTDSPVFSDIKNSENQQVAFNNHFTGKIYSIQWNNSIENPTIDRMSNLYNLKFNVPRGPQWVDFSDFEETRGKNLLKDVGRISQAIENKQGNFYVTLNRVRMKND